MVSKESLLALFSDEVELDVIVKTLFGHELWKADIENLDLCDVFSKIAE